MRPLDPTIFSSYPCSIILDRYVLESAKTEDKIKLYRRLKHRGNGISHPQHLMPMFELIISRSVIGQSPKILPSHWLSETILTTLPLDQFYPNSGELKINKHKFTSQSHQPPSSKPWLNPCLKERNVGNTACYWLVLSISELIVVDSETYGP